MEPPFYNVIIKSAYIGDSEGTFLRLCHCSTDEVITLMGEIIWNHPGYMMEIYRYGEDDED